MIHVFSFLALENEYYQLHPFNAIHKEQSSHLLSYRVQQLESSLEHLLNYHGMFY